MDESHILALSIAQAVEADAELIEQLRQEDQLARDAILARALRENPLATFEPVPEQPALDEETLNTLRLLNTAPINGSDAGVSENGEEDLGAKDARDAQEAQTIQVTVDNADTTENQGTADSQDITNGQDMAQEQHLIEDQYKPGDEATEPQNVEADEVLTEGSNAIEEPVDDQPVETERQKTQNEEQAHESTELILALVEPSPTPAQSSDGAPIPDTKQCVSCQCDFPEAQAFEAPCSHHWCQTCFVRRVEGSMSNESLFPPTCCVPLPVEPGEFIPQEMVDRFREKAIEFETVDRTYCSDATCSAFISPQSIKGDIGRCSRCEKQTCGLCKQGSHENVCGQDGKAQEVLRLGEANGWKRCDGCKHLIELSTGCYHITCSCGHQFCYLCSARWKTCTCPMWNENRLVAVAAQRVANAGEQVRQRRAGANNAQRARCRHEQFFPVRGEHNCAACHDRLRIYILRCRDCNIDICNQCRSRHAAQRRG